MTCPADSSSLEYDLDEGNGKDDEQEPAHGGAEDPCAEAGGGGPDGGGCGPGVWGVEAHGLEAVL